MTAASVTLREVRDDDLSAFWEHARDPEAQQVAAVTREYHYDQKLFDAHMARVRGNPDVRMRTVLADGVVAGHVAVYGPPDEREVTYWIGRSQWGRGVATTALSQLIALEEARPVYAHVVADNTGSLRVLEKCGFVVTGRDRGFAFARGQEVDEVLLVLEGR
ncbi:GNAT family N-acetyltransferase [Streptomyces sp. NBC_00083]|uniref:GNAT family N-acetyltransferase n=1 Tax=Streptomyces sp. NBC_00083 TaxID=2975647 RepID=UPI00224FBF9D|nr:GNAT family N-acetyltransferase [Streptomyces sp. NBC_00083]MCX5384079.1 GNAT family N-acetyltransferase [Streptomyces sp. NBC_00083]